MPTAYAKTNPGRRTLPAAVAVLLVLSFLPPAWNAWAGWTADLVLRLIAPISHPVLQLSRSIAPGAGVGRDDPEALRAAREERDRFETLYLQALASADRLEQRIVELQRGLAINPGLRVRQIAAPVIARSSDLSSGVLSIRAGSASDVEPGAVVVVRAVQVVGRVIASSARTAQVRLITDENAGSVQGRVLLTPTGQGPACLLAPTGQGTLSGDVADDPAFSEMQIQVGTEVRLLDDTWPENAQMLVLGTVERVATDPDNPLRTVITVRPTVEVERVSEVTVRATLTPADEGGES